MNNDINIIHIDNTSPVTAVKFRVNTPNHHETVIINNNDDTFTVLHADDTSTIFTSAQLSNLFNRFPTLVAALNTKWSAA
jgi:hypothetical protein